MQGSGGTRGDERERRIEEEGARGAENSALSREGSEPPAQRRDDSEASHARRKQRSTNRATIALPAFVRPRERLLDRGASTLSELELLALVLGCAGPRPAWQVAEQLLSSYGSLPELGRVQATELSRTYGPSRAARLSAALELGRRALEPRERPIALRTAAQVYAYARPRLVHLTREVFHVLLLDSRSRLMGDRRVAEGGLASCALSPRDVFEPAIRESAPAVVFLHNHPSGDPTPSREDVALTHRLAQGARALGISMLDHVIVADTGFTSLSDRVAP